MSYAAVRTSNRSSSRTWPALVGFLAIGAGLSALGFLTTTPLLGSWFDAGPQVPWQPGIWVFVCVWSVLYLLDGVAGWLLWRALPGRHGARSALTLWTVQIVLQVAWLVAFAAQAAVSGALLWGVFVVVVVLDLATGAAAAAAWRPARAASVLLLVMLAWLLYGTVLSAAATAVRGA
jgi:tryptophan-rich sensory protein